MKGKNENKFRSTGATTTVFVDTSKGRDVIKNFILIKF